MRPQHRPRAAIDELLQRQRLFERLTRIQRSISHPAPLHEVVDAIVTGAPFRRATGRLADPAGATRT